MTSLEPVINILSERENYMKKISAMFTGLALAAMLTPAISMAQDAPQEPAQPHVIALKLPATGCTSDGFTEAGVGVIVVDADDIAKLGNGDIDAGIAKLPAPADVQAAFEKACSAFTAEVASTDLGEKPSDKAIASLKAHLKEFADAETTATGVHFGVAQIGLSAPTEGCQAPAPAPQ